jgi:hypothetical protein
MRWHFRSSLLIPNQIAVKDLRGYAVSDIAGTVASMTEGDPGVLS